MTPTYNPPDVVAGPTSVAIKSVIATLTIIIPSISMILGLSINSASAQTEPPITQAFYVTPSWSNNNDIIAYDYGVAQAKADKAAGSDSVAILDFGREECSNSAGDCVGTVLENTGTTWSISTDDFAALVLAEGYQNEATAIGSTDYDEVAIGTNNSYWEGYSTSLAKEAGVQWADGVESVENLIEGSSWDSVTAEAAGDWESFSNADGSGYSTVASWFTGYDNTYGVPVYDFGSANGCPGETGGLGPAYATGEQCEAAPGGDWSQANYYTVSWGLSSAYAVPEIYFGIYCDGNNDTEWADISLYGAISDGAQILFTGPMVSPYSPGVEQCTGTQAWLGLATQTGADNLVENYTSNIFSI